jgi:hypothetical protein
VFPALKDGVFYEQLTYFDIPEYEALKSWLQQTRLYFTLDYKRRSQFFSDITWNQGLYSTISLHACLSLAEPFGLKCERKLIRSSMAWTWPSAQ